MAFAALSTLVMLPALLAVIGPRINKWSWTKQRTRSVEDGFWHQVATKVMRRPVPFASGVVVVLLVLGGPFLVLGGPFLGISFNLADERALPEDAEAHRVNTTLSRDYTAREMEPVMVVAEGLGDPSARTAEIGDYASALSQLDNVARVDALTGSYAQDRQVGRATKESARYAGEDGTWLSVVPSVGSYSDEGQDVVREVRATKAPFDVTVGGTGPAFRDTMDSLGDRLPYSIALIAVSTFVLLFLLTGSVLVPVKALVLNLLSLTATFGAMVWIFQDGHLRWLVGDFTVTGGIVATTPIMMFCVVFGLSMDYEVFLLSRIKEEYDLTGDNTRSVALGLERTGCIVTAAAVLVATVFLSFAVSGITYMKILGLGMALAVIMDATLVRGVLVPAFMRLAGTWNWWAPGPLASLRRRFGLREGGAATAPAPAASRGDSEAGC